MNTPVMFFFIFIGLLVRAVGFILLFIKMSSNKVGEKDSKKLCMSENLFRLGKLNKGDNAITPERGRLGFYYSNAKTSKQPNP